MKNTNKKSIKYSLHLLTVLAFVLIFVPINKAAAAYGTNTSYDGLGGYNQIKNNPKPTISLINPKSSNLGVGTKTITVNGSGFFPGSIVRINGANRYATFIDSSHLLVQVNSNDMYAYRANGGFFISVFNGEPGGGYSNAVFFTVNTPVVTTTTNTNNNNYNNSNTTGYTDNTNTNYSNTNNSSTNSTNTYSDTNNSFTNTSTDRTNSDTNNSNTNTTDTTNGSYSNLASNAIFGSNTFLPSGLVQWVLLAIIIMVIVIIARKIFGAKQNYEEAPMKHA